MAIAATAAIWLGNWDGDPLAPDARIQVGQVWRLATDALPHVGFVHLIFNLYWLWVFGTVVEEAFGHWATLSIYGLFAVGSSAAQYTLSGPGVGLSGVDYGLFGLVWFLSRHDSRFADVADGRTVALFLGWFVLCCGLTTLEAWNVGNVAHAAGAILGVLLGAAVTAYGRLRVLAVASIVAVTGLSILGAVLTPFTSEDLAVLAYRDAEAGQVERAIVRYEAAVKLDPGQPDYWRNLAICYQQLGRTQEAVEAYRKAVALRPGDAELRRELAGGQSLVGYERAVAGDLEKAIELYREALAGGTESAAVTWYNLGLAYQSLDQLEPARDAFRQAIALEPANAAFRTAFDTIATAEK